MARALTVAFLAGLVEIAAVVLTAEPNDPVAVAGLLVGLAVVAFALASAGFYYLARARRRQRAREALRRGALVAGGLTTLAFLRAIDALTVVTALFVLGAVAALEGALSARG